MFPIIIGVNEKFLNLDQIVMVEDVSESDTESKALISLSDGCEPIELTGVDADVLFEKLEICERASSELISKLTG